MKQPFPVSSLSFATRIGLVLVTSVAAVWIVAVVLCFLSQSRTPNGAHPLPTQIVAIVDLVENTPATVRHAVLAVVASDTLQATLEPGVDVGRTGSRPVLQLGERTLDSYLAKLGGRPLSVTLPDQGDRWSGWSRFAVPDALQFRIALKTGQTLVIDTRSTPLVTLFGLPVGFGVGLFGTLIALIALDVLLRETKPLARLASEVDRIDVSNPYRPIDVPRRSAPEIHALIGAFDRLQTRLAQLTKARLAMIGGISHDVRTFATRLRLRVDAIDDGDQRQRAIGDIDDMIRLLDDALLSSRAAVGDLAEQLVEVGDVVREEVNDRVAGGGEITLYVDPEAARATVLGDRLAIRRIVANLVDNALRFGDRVEVGLGRSGDRLDLTVDDDGPGIPEDQRALLLEPFVRLEGSRNRRTGGAGLGLAIVRNLADAQGGNVRIETSTRGGARLVVCLPLFISDAPNDDDLDGWCARRESNARPLASEANTLSPELRAHGRRVVIAKQGDDRRRTRE